MRAYGPHNNPFAPPPQSRPPRRRPPRWVTGALLPAVVGGAVALGGAALVGGLGGGETVRTVVRTPVDLPIDEGGVAPAPAVAAAADERPFRTVQDIVRRASPAVVRVVAGSRGDQRLGSGFLADDRGRFLTNAHVLGDADRVAVTFDDATERAARVLGRDPSTDLAVLEVADLPAQARPLPLGRSQGLVVGDEVVAIGNPFGLERTATTGIVSALERQIDAPNSFPIQNAIQTDAAINQGNSGGPLLDRAGRVVGINSQIATADGGSNGVGFAVPIDTIRPVAESIIETGNPEHAWIGIVGRQLTPDQARELGVAGRRGVAVLEVDDRGPSRAAGLQAARDGVDAELPEGADVIVAIDGRAVADMADVSQAIASKRVGARVTLSLVRDGARRELELTLQDRPSDIGLEP